MLPYCIYFCWFTGGKYSILDQYVIPRYGVCQPIFVYLLSLLVMLHYYWFSMFCNMIYKAITKGDTEDRQNDTSKLLASNATKKDNEKNQ